ncbi:hypothetical protein M8J77_024197 [Diaphorina citri]|nr:hypothetical protein M8J77_024197 [Diaphorina citri]
MVSLIPEWMMTRIDFIKDEIVTHEVVDNWFLMPSWLPVTSIVVLYLIFVKIVGPRMMENRKPYNIKNIILVYNLVQTVYNAYILSYLFYPGVISYLFNHSCSPQPRETNPLWMTFCEASYLYFISKIVDLLDTIFFVLRKKNSQISFLHVYHHVMMVFATWAFLRYFKGEQGIFVGALNSLVHVVMYSYYFLAALGPEVQKYLWWKKYITKFQLTQFGLFCIHQVSLIVFSCDMPVALTYFIFSQAVVMCVLFGNFYYQTYTKKNK